VTKALSEDRRNALRLVPVSRETEDRFSTLVEALSRWQTIKNLVGPGTLDMVWTRHIADSAQLLRLAPNARIWVDLGSGAGFPGLVVAIMLAGTEGAAVHLIESNARKCAFLRETARILEVPAIVHHARIEDSVARDIGGPVDVVSARALAPLDELLTLSSKLLTRGAIGLFPKGRHIEAELTKASKYWRLSSELVPSLVDPEGRILVVKQVERRAG
jgi:16S rRNA (guanine527-N7)-methyltransferase